MSARKACDQHRGGRLVAASIGALCTALLPAQNLTPAPWIAQGGVVNAASHMPQALPGGALAPGALISIEGLRFGSGDAAVEIELSGRRYPAIVLKSDSERILARMPRRIQAGEGQLFVHSHGKRSLGAPIIIAASNFGIFTANAKGWGRAASVQGAGSISSALPQLHAGSNLVLSGTGLGLAKTSSLALLLGGRTLTHVTRTDSDGIERLSAIVPAGVPEGCSVPVAVRVGGSVSNVATVAIGPGDHCKADIPTSDQPGFKSASVLLLRSDVMLELTPGKPVHFMLDTFSAGFNELIAPAPPGPLDLLPPAGSCTTWAGRVDQNDLAIPALMRPRADAGDLDLGPAVTAQTASLRDLDAGPTAIVAGAREVRVTRSTRKPHVYSSILGGNPPLRDIPPTPLFLEPGEYELRLLGGEDIPAFTTRARFPASVLWANRDSLYMIDRAAGAQFEWTNAPDYRGIVLAWNIDRRHGLAGFAACVPASGVSALNLPAWALANFPATPASGSDLSLGFAGVIGIPVNAPALPIPGLDHSSIIAATLSGRSVVFH